MANMCARDLAKNIMFCCDSIPRRQHGSGSSTTSSSLYSGSASIHCLSTSSGRNGHGRRVQLTLVHVRLGLHPSGTFVQSTRMEVTSWTARARR